VTETKPAVGRRPAATDRGVRTQHASPMKAVAKPPNITRQHIAKWLISVSPKRGSPLRMFDDKVVAAVMNACNREWDDQLAREKITIAEIEFRGRMQPVRTALDTILSEFPSIIRDFATFETELPPSSQRQHDHQLVLAAYPALRDLRELFNSTRPPGGQRRHHVEFATQIALLIRMPLERQVGDVSFYPDSPLIRFVECAVAAVYDRAPTRRALSAAVSRHFAEISKRGFPRQ